MSPICVIVLMRLCVFVNVCTGMDLTFPLCCEQVSPVPLPGGASSTVHSSLLLSGEACCASMRLDSINALTIQTWNTRDHFNGSSWSVRHDGILHTLIYIYIVSEAFQFGWNNKAAFLHRHIKHMTDVGKTILCVKTHRLLFRNSQIFDGWSLIFVTVHFPYLSVKLTQTMQKKTNQKKTKQNRKAYLHLCYRQGHK